MNIYFHLEYREWLDVLTISYGDVSQHDVWERRGKLKICRWRFFSRNTQTLMISRCYLRLKANDDDDNSEDVAKQKI